MPFKGTNKDAYYSKRVQKAKTPEAKSKAYYEEKARIEKTQKNKPSSPQIKPISSTDRFDFGYPKPPRYTPTRVSPPRARTIANPVQQTAPVKPKPKVQTTVQSIAPKNSAVTNSFSVKQPLFAGQKGKAELANMLSLLKSKITSFRN